ncbi:MAG: hypothetical protein IE933_04370 [Sphingomonadales bacterium]|nr:hypothetical protein [Sphingomonadales bacterium]MBD3772814.1 hypothetical protein [Paracoccaceae bacterium]
MNAQSHDSFRAACDKLSARIDAEQFERFRWTRDEAPRLARLVQLVKDSVADRTDVEINEEGGSQTSKGFIVKVHGKRVAGVMIALEQGLAVMNAQTASRSDYVVREGEDIVRDCDDVDEAWISEALGALFARIRPRRKPGAE